MEKVTGVNAAVLHFIQHFALEIKKAGSHRYPAFSAII